MVKKTKNKLRSPAAIALRSGQFQPKRVKSKKTYTRKEKHRD